MPLLFSWHWFLKLIFLFMGFPGGSAGKESTCNAGELGSIPGLGRFLGEGNGYLLQYSGLENSMDCIVPWGHKESDTIQWLSLHFLYGPTLTSIHDYWTTIALTIWTFVGEVLCLLFNTLSRFVIAFFLRSKRLLISWLQSPSPVILEPNKIQSVTASISPLFYLPWSDETRCHDLRFLNVEF